MLDTETNIAGIYRMIVVADDGFDTSLGAYTCKPNAVMCEFLFAYGTCSLTVSDSISENGKLYISGINFDLPKITPELRNWLNTNAERRWVCFAEDFNDYTHIIGEAAIGCVLAVRQTTGPSSSSKNLSNVSLSVSSINRPIITEMNFIDLTSSRTKIDLRRYAEKDIYVYEGDTISEVLTFRDANGNIENLTGSSFKMQVRNPIDNSVTSSFTMGGGFSFQNNNTELKMHKTELIAAGTYDYDLQRTYPDGIVETQMVGKFIVEKQVTI